MPDDREAKLPEATLSEFFESKRANITFNIREKIDARLFHNDSCSVKLPSIRLWCDTSECQSVRVFQPNKASIKLLEDKKQDSIVEFACCSCHESVKKYVFWCAYASKSKQLMARKLGEDPPFLPRLPSRLRTLIGSDQDKLDKGLRNEDQALGVGAFAYYRQIVENQKDRLIGQIEKVANLRTPPPKVLLQELEEARRQTQFSSAVEKIKHAIPEALQIKGHNPLSLLHKALSEGLHAGTDTECLEIAQDIRVILSEFSERLHNALKDERELNEAVSRIQNRPKKAQ